MKAIAYLLFPAMAFLSSAAGYGADTLTDKVGEGRDTGSSVTAYGALRAMMHEGAVGPVVALSALLPDSSLYAVGALAELSGEVTVLAGVAYLSYPDAEGARTEVATRTDVGAALLVASSVTQWQAVVTERPIPFEFLDEEIGRMALSAGVDSGDRLVFLVEGEVEELEWHVIDGRQLGAGPSSHEAHRAAAVKERRERAPAVLVGFYSESDQGVFTHMGSKTHIHCVVEDSLSAGHVDHVVIPTGVTVRFGAGEKEH